MYFLYFIYDHNQYNGRIYILFFIGVHVLYKHKLELKRGLYFLVGQWVMIYIYICIICIYT